MTIGLHLSLTVFTLSTLSPIVVSEIALFSCALQNVMACRAHRLLRSGKIDNRPVFLFSGPLSGNTRSSGYPSGIRSENSGVTDLEHLGGCRQTSHVYDGRIEVPPQSFELLQITATPKDRRGRPM